MAGLTRFEKACLTVVALAALLRVTYVLHPQPDWDAAWYLTLARSFADTGTSALPWTDPPRYDTYWPPLFPLFVAPFVKVVGPSYHTLVLAACVASALLVAVVFYATSDLFGRTTAFATMAAVAASPAFYVSDSRGMSESLLALVVTVALWGFLRGLSQPRYLAVAAVFGALAYLAKASVGLAIVAPVLLVALAWRVWAIGPRAWMERRTEVGLALGALVGIAIVALARPGKLGGVGLGVIGPVRDALASGAWPGVFVFKLGFAAVFLLFVTLPFSLELPAAWRARRDEREGALWLATILPLVAGAIFMTTFQIAQHRPLVDFDNIRYLVPSVVPLLWLTVPRFFADGPAPSRDRWVVGSAAALALVFALSPIAVTLSLPRLVVLAALMLVALSIALPARRGAKRQRRSRVLPWVIGLAAPLLSFYVSFWFAMVAVGLVAASFASAPSTRAVAMALVLLTSAAPVGIVGDPHDGIAKALLALPPGTVVGLDAPEVYVAAIAPPGLRVRTVDPTHPAAEVGAMVLGNDLGAHPGFARIQVFETRRDPNDLLRARLAIERAIGIETPLTGVATYALYVRDAAAPAP